jgi:hypothetical protein
MEVTPVPAVHDVQDLGRRAGNATVEVNLALRLNHKVELDHLVTEQNRPGSPRYHHRSSVGLCAWHLDGHRGRRWYGNAQ